MGGNFAQQNIFILPCFYYFFTKKSQKWVRASFTTQMFFTKNLQWFSWILDYYEYAEAEGSISEEYSGSGGVDYADETLELIKSLEENPTKDLMEFFNQQSKPIIDKLTENHSSNLIKYISGRLSYMYDKLFSRLN